MSVWWVLHYRPTKWQSVNHTMYHFVSLVVFIPSIHPSILPMFHGSITRLVSNAHLAFFHSFLSCAHLSRMHISTLNHSFPSFYTNTQVHFTINKDKWNKPVFRPQFNRWPWTIVGDAVSVVRLKGSHSRGLYTCALLGCYLCNRLPFLKVVDMSAGKTTKWMSSTRHQDVIWKTKNSITYRVVFQKKIYSGTFVELVLLTFSVVSMNNVLHIIGA